MHNQSQTHTELKGHTVWTEHLVEIGLGLHSGEISAYGDVSLGSRQA